MAEILQLVLKISIMVFMVGNMAGMGAELAMGEGLAALRNVRFMVMTVVWGWVLCPSFAYSLTKIIPMESPSEDTGCGSELRRPPEPVRSPD